MLFYIEHITIRVRVANKCFSLLLSYGSYNSANNGTPFNPWNVDLGQVFLSFEAKLAKHWIQVGDVTSLRQFLN